MTDTLIGMIAVLLLMVALYSTWGIVRAIDEMFDWDIDNLGLSKKKGL